VIEISDPGVMRSTRPVQQGTKDGWSWNRKAREPQILADPKPKPSPAPEWQLGADLIQG
jgi:hypothetical protein